MVTQKTLHTRKGKQVICECCYTCAPISELPSNISNMRHYGELVTHITTIAKLTYLVHVLP